MAIRPAEVYRKKIVEPVNHPTAQKTVVQKSNDAVSTSKLGEIKFKANQIKFDLTNKLTANAPSNTAAPQATTPYEAVEKIKKLPVPPLNDQAATRTYQQQRADIADTALKTAIPPARDQFKGLPPKLASMEYQDSLRSYNDSVSTLKSVSAAANADLKAQPTAVLDDSAKRVWDAGKYDPHAGAAALAKEVNDLNAKYGPEAGGQLVGKLYQDSKGSNYDKDLNNILTFAGGKEANRLAPVGLPEAQRNSIGTAVGQAYDKMSPADRGDFVKGLVVQAENDGFRSSQALGGDPARVGDLLARSGSEALKGDAAKAMIARMNEITPKIFGNNGNADVNALSTNAAAIAAGSDNAALKRETFDALVTRMNVEDNSKVDVKTLANNASAIVASAAPGAEQTKMFNTLIKNFGAMDDDTIAPLMQDAALKDNLSKAFINNSEAIMKGLTGGNENTGYLNSPEAKDGLQKFFEMTVFAGNPGQLNQDTMAAAIKTLSRFGDPTALPTAGRTKAADATTAGSLVAVIQNAALAQKDAIEADQENRKEKIELIVGTASAFLPGASKILGEGASELLQTAFDEGKDKLLENAQDGVDSSLQALIDKKPLENIETLAADLRKIHYSNRNALNGSPDLADHYSLGYASEAADSLINRELGGN